MPQLYSFNGKVVTDPAELVDGKLYVALRDDEAYTAARADFDKACALPHAC